MISDSKSGTVLIAVLVIAVALFSLVNLVVAANYSLRQQNRRCLQDMRERATKLHPCVGIQSAPKNNR